MDEKMRFPINGVQLAYTHRVIDALVELGKEQAQAWLKSAPSNQELAGIVQGESALSRASIEAMQILTARLAFNRQRVEDPSMGLGAVAEAVKAMLQAHCAGDHVALMAGKERAVRCGQDVHPSAVEAFKAMAHITLPGKELRIVARANIPTEETPDFDARQMAEVLLSVQKQIAEAQAEWEATGRTDAETPLPRHGGVQSLGRR